MREADVARCDECGNIAIYSDGHKRGCWKHMPEGDRIIDAILPFAIDGNDTHPCEESVVFINKGKETQTQCGIPTIIQNKERKMWFCAQHAQLIMETEKRWQSEFVFEPGARKAPFSPEEWTEATKNTYEPIMMIKEEQGGGGKRVPVKFRFDLMNWKFLGMMAQIADYASHRYDKTPTEPWGWLNYQVDKLIGEKSPKNHMVHHLAQYLMGKPYDKFDRSVKWHLVAIAYNAMMCFFYEEEEEEKLERENP